MSSSGQAKLHRPRPNPTPPGLQRTNQGLALGALLSLLLILGETIFRRSVPGPAGWPQALLVLTTLGATLTALAKQLPAARVLTAAAAIGIIGGGAHAIGAWTAVPFGPFTFLPSMGPTLFHYIVWPMPALWIIITLNSRSVARLILRPWRKLKSYPFWLIGVSTVLIVFFDLGLEPVAAQGNRYWLWLPTKFPVTWYGTPLVNFLGWALTALLILGFATPALVTKQQRSHKGPQDYQPLVIWGSAMSFFAIQSGSHQFWLASGACVAVTLAVTVFAIRGARW